MRIFMLAAMALLVNSTPTLAQTGNADAIAIEGQLDAFIASWNRHDFSDMANYVADDCDFVNVGGMHWRGREEIQYAHQFFHRSVLLNTPMKKLSVSVRFLKPDVGIAHMLWHIGLITNPPQLSIPRTKPDGDNDDLATVVLVKRKGTWLITAMQNVVVNEELAPNDPVKLRKAAQPGSASAR